MPDNRYNGIRLLVPEGSDITKLCVCCTYTDQSISRDGKWAKCVRCRKDCTNVGCRTLRPNPRGIYGRFARRVWSRLFR